MATSMKSCIATVSIAGDFREKLAAIARAGFTGIEIFEQDFIAFDGRPEDVADMVKDHGLEIMLFQPFRDFEGMPDALRDRAFDRAERKFDLMNQLGVDLMLVCSNVSPHSLGGIDRAADDFAALGESAAAKGIRVGYEALAWGRHISDHRDAWEVVRRADHAHIGIILDSFHTLGRGLDPQSIRAIPRDKIFFVQLADAPLIEMDLLYWSRHFRNMPGEGDLPVLDFMRAGVLGAELFSQPSVPGELDIPAIKGVGGGVIHFIDDKSDLARLWEIDFVQDNQPANGGVGLVAIDHIAQTMKYEEMLTWALFYTSIFDTSKVPMVDVVDPAGLVRSRAIQNDEGSLRITLNGAESQDTLAGRFISETFGSSVQHIAFASDDIFATAAALSRNGFEALTISANYYDDLGARFGLDDQLLDKLKAAQILYDCDEAGAYFHFYGQMLGAGIFFEIVQRTEAYNGYGAANAPFRISAQKRDWASA